MSTKASRPDNNKPGRDKMLIKEIIMESPAADLAKRLPSLTKHDYNTLDELVGKVATRHNITKDALHNLFIQDYSTTPKDWIKKHLTETDDDQNSELDIEEEVQKCSIWAAKKLHIKRLPKIELSMDTEEAQHNHHTGGHIPGSDKIWVYAKNRNLVDLLRTVLHELVHVRQQELGQIKPGDSYPGSPIEVEADSVAGVLIKRYGEKNHHIFQ